MIYNKQEEKENYRVTIVKYFTTFIMCGNNKREEKIGRRVLSLMLNVSPFLFFSLLVMMIRIEKLVL